MPTSVADVTIGGGGGGECTIMLAGGAGSGGVGIARRPDGGGAARSGLTTPPGAPCIATMRSGAGASWSDGILRPRAPAAVLLWRLHQ